MNPYIAATKSKGDYWALVAARRACWVDGQGCASSATGAAKGPTRAPTRGGVSTVQKPTPERPPQGGSLHVAVLAHEM